VKKIALNMRASYRVLLERMVVLSYLKFVVNIVSLNES
jgi:hypothetical protein